MSDTLKELIIDAAIWYVGGLIGKAATPYSGWWKVANAVQAIALTRAIGFAPASIEGENGRAKR